MTCILPAFMGRHCFVLLSLIVLLHVPDVHAQTTASTERRVALVVGNASYRISPLKNSQNDARAVSSALRKLNFEVIERHNLGREAFSMAIREFGDRLKGANVGLFYFAGHGLQVKGRNYLVPVDVDIAREDEVPYRGLDVNEVLDKMDSARTAINLVVLDACRNNPFARSFKLSQIGLAQMDAPQGTLISFATAPGSVAQDGEGSNGLFTGALLKHIGTQGLAVEQMFKRVRVDVVRESNNQQVSWESSSLNRDFSFAKTAPGADAPQAPLAAAGRRGSSDTTELGMELAFWESIRDSRNPADYRAYLEQYPQGRFASLARIREQATFAATLPRPVSIIASNTEALSPSRSGAQALSSEIALPYGPGATLRGFSNGRLSYRIAGAPGMRIVDLGTAAPVTELALSPEGLYLVAVSARQLHWIDLELGSVLRRTNWSPDISAVMLGLEFSANGRWLLLKMQRQGQSNHQLIDVGTGQVVWDKPSATASFDLDLPAIRLQDAAGQLDILELPS
jgi:uncharacterized caspase-like protein